MPPATARPPRPCSPSIVREGAKAVAAGINPMDLKRGIDLAVDAIVADLKKHAKKVCSNDGNRAGRHNLRQWR